MERKEGTEEEENERRGTIIERVTFADDESPQSSMDTGFSRVNVLLNSKRRMSCLYNPALNASHNNITTDNSEEVMTNQFPIRMAGHQRVLEIG